MKKKEIKYAAVLTLLFVAAVLFEVFRPKPIDWSPTFSDKDKIPYGTYVLYSLMGELFEEGVVESRVPAYNYLQKDSTLRAHYLSISQYTAFDENDVNALLDFAAGGNSVFISARYMYNISLLDTLHIEVKDTTVWRLSDSTAMFTNPRLGSQTYRFRKSPGSVFFDGDSLSKFTVLGKNGSGGPDFIKVDFGKGAFYLHLLPAAFSNYHVLDTATSDYAFKALSYLSPDRPVIWDEYVHRGRVGEQSVMRVVMQYPALRWAYYIAIFGILLFVIFEGKRRQRIIPVVKPLQNTTLEFLDVVSRLYFQKQDHKGIARKKIIFFMEQIRTRYRLPTNKLDEEFVETLSRKSGYPPEKTKYLIWKICRTEAETDLTADDLTKLSDEMEDFYANTR